MSIQCSRCIYGCNDAEWHWLKDQDWLVPDWTTASPDQHHCIGLRARISELRVGGVFALQGGAPDCAILAGRAGVGLARSRERRDKLGSHRSRGLRLHPRGRHGSEHATHSVATSASIHRARQSLQVGRADELIAATSSLSGTSIQPSAASIPHGPQRLSGGMRAHVQGSGPPTP